MSMTAIMGSELFMCFASKECFLCAWVFSMPLDIHSFLSGLVSHFKCPVVGPSKRVFFASDAESKSCIPVRGMRVHTRNSKIGQHGNRDSAFILGWAEDVSLFALAILNSIAANPTLG